MEIQVVLASDAVQSVTYRPGRVDDKLLSLAVDCCIPADQRLQPTSPPPAHVLLGSNSTCLVASETTRGDRHTDRKTNEHRYRLKPPLHYVMEPKLNN